MMNLGAHGYGPQGNKIIVGLEVLSKYSKNLQPKLNRPRHCS
jgi:hypothetical protein